MSIRSRKGISASSSLLMLTAAMLLSCLAVTAQSPPPNVGFVSYIDLPDDSQARVDKIAVQPDGRILIAGAFSQIQNRPRAGLARLHSSGSIDVSFNPARSGMFALQADGKIIVANRTEIVRLNSDGSLDRTFTAIPISKTGRSVWIRAVSIEPDGKIYVLGDFDQVGGHTRNDLARLNADGTFDATLGDVVPVFDGIWSANLGSVAVQPDGKILVGGGFTGIAGSNRRMLARLNSDGSIDNSFTHNLTSNTDDVRQIILRSDGKMYVTGTVEYGAAVPSASKQGVFRVNADGSLDAAFTLPNSLRGGFNGGPCVPASPAELYCTGAVPGRGGLNFLVKKLSATGADISLPNVSTSGDNVYALGVQGDGKVLAGGDFGYAVNGDPYLAGQYYLMPRTLTRLNTQLSWDGPISTKYDFTGDGTADIVLFRPSEGKWYIEIAGGGYSASSWGVDGDEPVAADFDGDTKSDIAVWRASEGRWYIINSGTFTIEVRHWGTGGDVPVPADYDGDRKADVMIFRPAEAVWYMISSIDLSIHTVQHGEPGSTPLAADFDFDLRADMTVYYPPSGKWSVRRSTYPEGQQLYERVFGTATDIPVPGVWGPSGGTDFAFFRPSTGGWHISNYRNPLNVGVVNWGQPGDIPVPADYNGGGLRFIDYAVYRPSDNTWYIANNFDPGQRIRHFGMPGDIPVNKGP